VIFSNITQLNNLWVCGSIIDFHIRRTTFLTPCIYYPEYVDCRRVFDERVWPLSQWHGLGWFPDLLLFGKFHRNSSEYVWQIHQTVSRHPLHLLSYNTEINVITVYGPRRFRVRAWT
jgi:hypothetical protein